MNVEEINETLARLQRAEPDVFGAESHRFRLNEPCGEDCVRSFESDARIVLPSDYRTFIASIGNGGAGPYYGIFQLGTMRDPGHDCGSWQDDVGSLAEPFHYTLQPGGDKADGDQGIFVLGPEGYRRRYRDAYTPNEHANSDWHTGPVDGAIPVCHMGCGYFVWLAVSGAEAGHLWYDGRAAEQGFEPILTESGMSTTFGNWYKEWLEASVRKIHP